MYCNKCGNLLSDVDQFCPKCGQAQEKSKHLPEARMESVPIAAPIEDNPYPLPVKNREKLNPILKQIISVVIVLAATFLICIISHYRTSPLFRFQVAIWGHNYESAMTAFSEMDSDTKRAAGEWLLEENPSLVLEWSLKGLSNLF